jgi:hypothetical protein
LRVASSRTLPSCAYKANRSAPHRPTSASGALARSQSTIEVGQALPVLVAAGWPDAGERADLMAYLEKATK